MSGFRDFVLRGNVVELAVAFIIGAAFGTVVTSSVADILTPLLGLIGLPAFSTATIQVGDADVSWGVSLNAVISFILVAAGGVLHAREADGAHALARSARYEDVP